MFLFSYALSLSIRNTLYEIRSTKDYVRNYKQNMQNKANFQKSQMNVSTVITMNYEQRTMNYEIKNKPNSNPKQTQYKPNTNPIQTQYKAKQTQFLSAISVAGQRQKMTDQSLTELFANSLLFRLPPSSTESISIRSNFAATKYAAAAEGTIKSNLKIFGQLCESLCVVIIAAAIHSVAAIVFHNVRPKPSRMEASGPRFRRDLRRNTTRIATCKYEQSAVESANPPVPNSHIRVRFRKMFAITAIRALLIGVLESCIE